MSDNNEIEIAKIEELFAQWDAAVETSNLDGYVDGLDENITLMPPWRCCHKRQRKLSEISWSSF